MSFSAFNATSHSMVLLVDWNYLLAQGLDKSLAFLVRAYGVYFEALDGTTGKLAYGGATNEGATDGTDVAAVQQAAVDNAGSGIVYIKDLTLDGTVTSAAGVIIVVDHDGVITYNFDNPDTEVPSQTNTQNVITFNILAQPQADPTLDALNALTSEIIGKPGLTKYLVAGYFGAKAIGAENIWGLNPLVWLTAASTGDALGIEVDMLNEQADGKGEGVQIVHGTGSDYDSYAALHIKADAYQWQRGIILQNCEDYGIVFEDATDEVFYGNMDNGWTGNYCNWNINGTNVVTWEYTGDCKIRRAAVGNYVEGYVAAEANARMLLTYQALEFGAGVGVTDAKIVRLAANVLKLEDTSLFAVMSASTDDAFVGYQSGDANFRLQIRADGAMYWGDGTNAVDCLLYRSAANVLSTDAADTIKAGYFQPQTGYNSVDGTAGATNTADLAGAGTLNFKNGLYVGTT